MLKLRTTIYKLLKISFVTLLALNLSSCKESNTNELQEAANNAIENSSLVVLPSEEYIQTTLTMVPNVVHVAAATEENDPNGNLGKDDGYYSAVFFSVDLLDTYGLSGDALVDEGTSAGGCIEAYPDENTAKKRNDYLSGFDTNTIVNSGGHALIGTLVVRTSSFLDSQQQIDLTKNIVSVLTGGEIPEPIPAPTITIEATTTPNPTATSIPSSSSEASDETKVTNASDQNTDAVSSYSESSDVASLSVSACDLSGYREPNAVVDVGYGDREYWAYTNEYGQLVRVTAAEIVLQTDDEANSNGRYCSDEAKVPGVEDSDLDEGHIIADSLGGVSNAYNITPMNSTLNRYGDQAYMEKTIRDAGGATDFECIITYPNTETMIPSHYKYTYTVWGNQIVDEFDNVNPEDTIPDNSYSNSSNTYTEPQKSQSQLDCENGGGIWRDGSWCEWPKSQAQIDCENGGGVWTDNSWCNWPQSQSQQNSVTVWISATGSKYHSIPNCGNMNPDKASQITLSDAQSRGLEPCSKCW